MHIIMSNIDCRAKRKQYEPIYNCKEYFIREENPFYQYIVFVLGFAEDA